jgi:hypothetical protein
LWQRQPVPHEQHAVTERAGAVTLPQQQVCSRMKDARVALVCSMRNHILHGAERNRCCCHEGFAELGDETALAALH